MSESAEQLPILIVDDEPINLKRAAQSLHTEYELHFARSGEEAIAFLKTQKVKIILLDISMPGMDGFEVAKAVKTNPQTAQIPIIFLTGDSSEETIEQAFDSGAADYITKPFRDKELLARIKNRIETEFLRAQLKTLSDDQQHLIEIINDHVFYVKTDLKGIITEISRSFCRTIKCSEEQIVGHDMSIFKSGHTPEKTYQAMWRALKNGQIYTYEIENNNFQGGTNWYKVTVKPDTDASEKINGYVAFYNNIDDQIRYQQNSYLDYLTGLNNRAKFERELRQEIYRFKRYKQVFSVIMIDIDFFKKVNDDFGHDIGDSLLVEFSNIIACNSRQLDVVARWGGEEFIILCPNTNLEGAVQFAEVLREKVQQTVFKKIGHKTASFGVVEFTPQHDEKSLFVEVDKALYEAKNTGRNKVVAHKPK